MRVGSANTCLTSAASTAVSAVTVGHETSGTSRLTFVPQAHTVVYHGVATRSTATPIRGWAPQANVAVVLVIAETTSGGSPAVALFPRRRPFPAGGYVNLLAGAPAALLGHTSGGPLRLAVGATTGTAAVKISVTGQFVTNGAHDSLAIPTVSFDGASYAAPGLELSTRHGCSTPAMPANRWRARAPTCSTSPATPWPGATAVLMNVTVTGTTGPGFVTAHLCSDGRPTASNLNLGVGPAPTSSPTWPVVSAPIPSSCGRP